MSERIDDLTVKLRDDRLNQWAYGGGEYKLSDRVIKFVKENKYSQDEIVLAHILAFGFITNKECNELYGFRHLPSIIQTIEKKIEKDGKAIKTTPKDGESRFGKARPYFEYSVESAA